MKRLTNLSALLILLSFSLAQAANAAKLAYVTTVEKQGNCAIRVVDLATKRDWQLHKFGKVEPTVDGLGWSRDGSKLIFSSYTDGPTSVSAEYINIMDVGTPENLKSLRRGHSPNLLPSGVLYSGGSRANDAVRLNNTYVVRVSDQVEELVAARDNDHFIASLYKHNRNSERDSRCFIYGSIQQRKIIQVFKLAEVNGAGLNLSPNGKKLLYLRQADDISCDVMLQVIPFGKPTKVRNMVGEAVWETDSTILFTSVGNDGDANPILERYDLRTHRVSNVCTLRGKNARKFAYYP